MDTMSNTDTPHPRVLGLTVPKACVAARCGRCGGAGGWSGWPGFTCYRCGGNGQDPTHREFGFPPAWTDEQCQVWTDERDARLHAAAVKRHEKAQAKADRARLHAVATYPVIATLDRIRLASAANDEGERTASDPDTGLHWFDMSGFVTDVFWKACRDGYALSDKQISALERAVQQALAHVERKAGWAAEQAAAQPVPTGKRVTIEGVVVSLRWYESEYGSVQKAMVKGDAGWRVFVSVPSSSIWEIDDRVRFDAEVTASDDDPTFGKGKRPTKAQMVEQAPDPDPEPNPNGCVGGTCGPVGTWSCSKHGAEYQNRYGRAANE